MGGKEIICMEYHNICSMKFDIIVKEAINCFFFFKEKEEEEEYCKKKRNDKKEKGKARQDGEKESELINIAEEYILNKLRGE